MVLDSSDFIREEGDLERVGLQLGEDAADLMFANRTLGPGTEVLVTPLKKGEALDVMIVGGKMLQAAFQFVEDRFVVGEKENFLRRSEPGKQGGAIEQNKGFPAPRNAGHQSRLRGGGGFGWFVFEGEEELVLNAPFLVKIEEDGGKGGLCFTVEDRGPCGVIGMGQRDRGELLVIAKEEPLVALHHGHEGGRDGQLAGLIEDRGVKVGGVEAIGIKRKWGGSDDIGSGMKVESAPGEIGMNRNRERVVGNRLGDFYDRALIAEPFVDFAQGIVDGAMGEAGDENPLAPLDQLFDKAGESVGFASAGRALNEVKGTGGQRDRDGVRL